jgi:hypothetical protein
LESTCAFILRAGSTTLSTWNSCACHPCINRVSTFITPNIVLDILQQQIKRKKKDSTRKGGSQIVPICREYDPIFKRPQRLHQEILRSDKHFQQSSRIQNQRTTIKLWEGNQENSSVHGSLQNKIPTNKPLQIG